MEILELGLHLTAEVQVECAERLVEQKDPWLGADGTSDGDTLLLTAGQLGGEAFFVAGHADEGESLVDAARDLRAGVAFAFAPFCVSYTERVGDIFEDVLMRKESVALEDGIHLTQVRLGGGDVTSVKKYTAGVSLLESADDTEEGRFSAAGRTEDRQKLTAFDGEGEVADDRSRAEGL